MGEVIKSLLVRYMSGWIRKKHIYENKRQKGYRFVISVQDRLVTNDADI